MNTGKSDPKENAERLLAYLRQLKNDRGAMANLRCALSPARRPRAWPLLARVSGIGNRRIETFGGLYAYHPEETHTGNIGTLCRHLAGLNTTFDGRFRRLLACDGDEIYERLRPVVLAAGAKGAPVNYQELYVDLCYWGSAVKARWAREYWRAAQEEASPAASEVAP